VVYCFTKVSQLKVGHGEVSATHTSYV